MRAVWAWQQPEELRGAIWDWLTEPATTVRAAGRSRKFAYAFHLWIAHLAMLEQLTEISPARLGELLAAEAEGLQMLKAARQRYAREYRSCEECGTAVRGKICPRCGAIGRNGSTLI
jgi:rubrerythrin